MAFPFVECNEHGRQRGYAVCRHVLSGVAPPSHVVLATDSAMGELFCGLPKHNVYEMGVLCSVHVRELWGVSDDRTAAAPN